MDKLSVGKRVKVQNMPHHRLVAYLIKMGLGEEELDSMSMDQLREASAEIIVSGRETPPEVSEEVSTGSIESSSSSAVQLQLVELKRLRYEREEAERAERRKEEKEERQRMIEEERERRREEKEERQRKEAREEAREEAERLRLLEEKQRREEKEETERLIKEAKEEAEKLRLREEKQRREEKEETERLRKEEKEEAEKLRLLEEKQRREEKEEAEKLRLREEKQRREEKEEAEKKEKTVREEREAERRLRDERDYNLRHSVVGRMKTYSESLRGLLPRFPSDHAQIPGFFVHCERLFNSCAVPDDLRSRLLLTCLDNQARALTARLTQDELDNYGSLKTFLLKEFKVSAVSLRERFMNAKKAADESYTTLASRLHNLLSYYLQDRQALTFDDVTSLLIADKMKEMLPRGCLNFILSQEQQTWLGHKDLAAAADTYSATHPWENDFAKHSPGTSKNESRFAKASVLPQTTAKQTDKWTDRPVGTQTNNRTDGRPTSEEIRRWGLCFLCLSPNHRANVCLKNKQTKSKQVSACAVQPTVTKALDRQADGQRETRLDGPSLTQEVDQHAWPTNPTCIDVEETFVREYMRVYITGLTVTSSLIDSGAEYNCARADLIRPLNLPVVKQIEVKGLNGQPMVVDVVRLRLKGSQADEDKEGEGNYAPDVRIWAALIEGL